MNASAMQDMLAMLANGPEEMRRTAIKARIDELLNAPEQQRQEGIRMMMSTIQNLKPDQQRAIIRTRTEVIGALPEASRRALMMSRMQAMKSMPEANQADMMLTQAVLPEIRLDLRNAFTGTMNQLQSRMMGSASPQASSHQHVHDVPHQPAMGNVFRVIETRSGRILGEAKSIETACQLYLHFMHNMPNADIRIVES